MRTVAAMQLEVVDAGSAPTAGFAPLSSRHRYWDGYDDTATLMRRQRPEPGVR